jgi:hypothetical protein
LFYIAVASMILLVIVTLLASPFAMAAIARRGETVDWSRLGDVSDTFGAASALLAGLATGGVAVSLLLQTRQLQVGQIQGMRNMQLELMRMLLDDPILASVSPKSHDIPREQWRQEIYLNLLFKYLEMGYATNYVGEDGVRSHLREQFDVKSARLYWERAGPLWEQNATSKHRRRFFELVEVEYRAAVHREVVAAAQRASARPVSAVRSVAGLRRFGKTAFGLSLGVVLGAMGRHALAGSRHRIETGRLRP